jgi:hypothetical protein
MPQHQVRDFSIRSIPAVKDAPPLERRLEIAKEMDAYFERIDKKLEGVDERELEEAMEEAIREVRRGNKQPK